MDLQIKERKKYFRFYRYTYNPKHPKWAPDYALYFFGAKDEDDIPDKYFDGDYWLGTEITEDGFNYPYVNDWVEENTNYRYLSHDEYHNDRHRYMLLDVATIYKLAYLWPSTFNIRDDFFEPCLFSNKEGYKLYDEFVEHPYLVSVRVYEKPWTNGEEYRLFCPIPSSFISVPLRKKKGKIYWQQINRLTEKEFDQIYIAKMDKFKVISTWIEDHKDDEAKDCFYDKYHTDIVYDCSTGTNRVLSLESFAKEHNIPLS